MGPVRGWGTDRGYETHSHVGTLRSIRVKSERLGSGEGVAAIGSKSGHWTIGKGVKGHKSGVIS